jgi:diguanylate cyclase (GGDEF)-like protein/PAS domain S-box-containing protein
VHLDVRTRLHRLVPPELADDCSVWVLDGAGEDAVLTVVATSGTDPQRAAESELARTLLPSRSAGTGLLGRVLRTQHPVALTGAADVSAVHPAAEALLRCPPSSLVAVPVVARGAGVGVLLATRQDSRPPFSPSDVQRLQTAAEELALLLDNARLVEDVEQALAQLRSSRVFHSAVLAHSSDMVTVVDEGGAVRWASPSASRVLGWSSEELLGHDNLSLVHPEDRSRVAVRLGELLAGAPYGTNDRFRLRRKDGSWCWVEASGSDARSDAAVAGIVINARDVTAEVDSRSEVEERMRGQQQVLDAMPMSTALLDADGNVVAVNASWRCFPTKHARTPEPAGDRPTADECGDVVGGNVLAVCLAAGDETSLEVHAALRAVLSGTRAEFTTVLPCATPTGDRWYEMHVAPLTAGGGGAVVYYVDITENRRYAAEMAHQAAHDYLTGLPNRVALVAALHDAIAAHAGREAGLAVLFCDLDQFKLVNDSYGHEAGDEVLVEVAQRLSRVAGDQHLVARFAGDEFVLVCRQLEGPAAAIALAEVVKEAMSQPFSIQGRELSLSTSVGIALGSDTAMSGALLLRDADAALYEAKARGRARYAVFDATLQGRSERRLDLVQALPAALRSGEIVLHYQPLVDLHTLVPYGVEALLRWDRPVGPVPPLEFVPVAEENGFILELGRFVLETACAAAASWPALDGLQVSVNLSARQLLNDDIVAVVRDVLGRTGLPPGRLCLELTESQLMEDPDRAGAVLAELRRLGVGLAMDDFGTGYSSLAYLKRFPVDTLKIDRSFVSGLAEDADDAAIVTAVLALARALGLRTVAEGVETEEQARALRRLGCGHAQGYLFGRPALLSGLFPAPRSPADRRSDAGTGGLGRAAAC